MHAEAPRVRCRAITFTRTRIVKKDNIACLAVLSDALKGVHNILLGGSVMRAIVHQAQHIGWSKSMYILEKLRYIFSIVMTSTQLTLLALVVDPDQNSSFRACGSGRHNKHLFLDINQSRGSQLRDLIIAHIVQDCAHSS